MKKYKEIIVAGTTTWESVGLTGSIQLSQILQTFNPTDIHSRNSS